MSEVNCMLEYIWEAWYKQYESCKRRLVYCKCVCWDISIYQHCNVFSKWANTKSCWCYKKAYLKEKQTNKDYIKEPLLRKLHSIYLWIRYRCSNEKSKHYKNYWWRWIVCMWDSFEEFSKDMFETYKKSIENNKWVYKWTTIDRIDVNGNYCKINCRWISNAEQQRNTRKNIKHNNECLSEICREGNLTYSTIQQRITKLWRSKEEAINKPVKKQNREKFIFNGVLDSFSWHCKKLWKIPESVMRRIKNKWLSFEQAVY